MVEPSSSGDKIQLERSIYFYSIGNILKSDPTKLSFGMHIVLDGSMDEKEKNFSLFVVCSC